MCIPVLHNPYTAPHSHPGQDMERRGCRVGGGVGQVVRVVTVWGHLWPGGGYQEKKVQEEEKR